MIARLMRRRRARRPVVAVEWAGRRIEVEGYPPRATVALGRRLIGSLS